MECQIQDGWHLQPNASHPDKKCPNMGKVWKMCKHKLVKIVIGSQGRIRTCIWAYIYCISAHIEHFNPFDAVHKYDNIPAGKVHKTHPQNTKNQQTYRHIFQPVRPTLPYRHVFLCLPSSMIKFSFWLLRIWKLYYDSKIKMAAPANPESSAVLPADKIFIRNACLWIKDDSNWNWSFYCVNCDKKITYINNDITYFNAIIFEITNIHMNLLFYHFIFIYT